MGVNMINIQKYQEEPLEFQFRDEIAKRLFDYAYKKQIQYNKDLKIIDIPEFAKMSEDRIKSQIDVWILTLITEGRLFKAYNDYILNTI